jgi:DNA-binding response OmpR family regulator
LILLDLKLPQMSGFDVLRQIRAGALTRTVPVVVLSSSDEERDLAQSYGLGANSYIQKPVDYDRFVETIRAAGSYWISVNRVSSGR